MTVLVTCKCLKMIRSKVKVLSSGHFLHEKPMGKFFITQGRVTPRKLVRSGVRDFITPCYLQVWRRSNQKCSSYPRNNIFPIISLWELSVAVEISVDPISPKCLCSLSPPPPHPPISVMLRIQFNQDWPISLRDVQAWECGWTSTDHWYTISSPCEPLSPVS